MTDPLKKLKSAMDAAPAPKGAPAALSAALAAFDAEAAKETPVEPRPTPQTQSLRSFVMTTLSRLPRRPVWTGAAGLAAAAAAVFVIQPGMNFEPSAPGVFELSETAATKSAQTPAPLQAEAEVAAAAPAPAEITGARAKLESAVGKLLRPAPGPEAGAPQRRAMTLADEADAVMPMVRPLPHPETGDQFANAADNPVKLAVEDPVSTFSIDVDTASYSYMRRALLSGRAPSPEEVRVEELINYFPYAYPAPEGDAAFAVSTNVIDAPWAEGRKLLHIGLMGAAPQTPKRAVLTFLIDTSGSMRGEDRLPLLVASFRLLAQDLGPEDEVAIVTYAGSSEIVLPPTKAGDIAAIDAALDALMAGGGTGGAAGIETAYRLAAEAFDPEATNRVILATDGDFNIGAADPKSIERLIAAKRKTGVYLSVLGFGRGNLNDRLMQSLAQAGNGQAAYIDTLAEARKTLVEERAALHPIAADVKIQVEFNPAAVQDYRLIGYETRALSRADFNNDKVDAGEIGAGHRVTAIYEYTPVGGPARIDPLRYGAAAGNAPTDAAGDTDAAADAAGLSDEIAFLRLRHKAPGAAESQLTETPIRAAAGDTLGEARFAAAVAGFGQLLRGGDALADWSYADAAALARANLGEDPFGYRAAFIELVRLAGALSR